MCGIVAYNGNRSCRHLILDGLARLERYEYDSAGFVCIDGRHPHLSYHKEAGGISPIQRLRAAVAFDGSIGMANLRWTAHGIADPSSAQPHFNCKKILPVCLMALLKVVNIYVKSSSIKAMN